MAVAEESQHDRPEPDSRSDSAFRSQDEWRKAELRRVTGSDSVGTVSDSPVPQPLGARGAKHSVRSVGSAPKASIFTADLALIVIGIVLLALVVVGYMVYVPRDSRPRTKGNPEATVWANKEIGLYFCSGDKLFGKGKGQRMSQRAAQLQSYRPALDTECE